MIVYYLLVAVSPFAAVPLLSHVFADPFKVIGAVCFLYAIFQLLRRPQAPPFLRSWQARLFLCLYLLAAVSFITKSRAVEFTGSTLMIYTSFLLFFVATLALVDSPAKVRLVLAAATLGIALGTTYLFREWLVTHGRVGKSVGDGNYFSTSAVLCLPFALLVVLRGRRLLLRLFFGVGFMVALVGVMLCASRGGFAALAAALIVLVLHSRRRSKTLAVMAALIVPVILVSPVSPVRRLLSPNRVDRNSETSRLIAWRAGLKMIAEQPLFGVGLGNFRPLMRAYTEQEDRIEMDFESMAHNTYIEFAAELGLPGLALFLGILYHACRSLESVRRRTTGSDPLHLAALGLKAGLIGYSVGALFLSAEYQKLFWLVVFLSMCLPEIAAECRRRRPCRRRSGQSEEAPEAAPVVQSC